MSAGGYMRERRPGVWLVEVSTGRRDPRTGRYQRLRRTVRGGKREARRALAELTSDVGKGRAVVSATTVTLSELFERFIPLMEQAGRSPNTIRCYRFAAEVVLAELGDVPLCKLTASMLNGLYGDLGRRMKPASVVRIHAALSPALAEAVRLGWLDRNPASVARRPGLRNEEIVPPTPEQVRAIIAYAKERSSPLASMFHVAATTGCRRGELCALRWGDVDWRRRALVVQRSMVDIPGHRGEIKDTKGHRSRRIILDAGTLQVLSALRSEAEELMAALGTTLTDDDPLWMTIRAEPWRPDSVTQYMERATAALGFGFTFHGFRHFMVTQGLAQGQRIEVLARRAGHDPVVMMRVYAHFIEGEDAGAADAVGGLLRPALEAS